MNDQNIIDRNIKIRKYKPEIDGLRALAIIAVIINHFEKKNSPLRVLRCIYFL